MSPFGSTMARSGNTTSPLALSWQSLPTSSYPAGHSGLSVDCAAAGTDKRLTIEIVSASLRIVALHLARENRVHRHVGRRSSQAQRTKVLLHAFQGVARRSRHPPCCGKGSAATADAPLQNRRQISASNRGSAVLHLGADSRLGAQQDDAAGDVPTKRWPTKRWPTNAGPTTLAQRRWQRED